MLIFRENVIKKFKDSKEREYYLTGLDQDEVESWFPFVKNFRKELENSQFDKQNVKSKHNLSEIQKYLNFMLS